MVGRLTPTWTDGRTISLGGEQLSSLEIKARAEREAAKHVPEAFTRTVAQGYILEPTSHDKWTTKATYNKHGGLMKIIQSVIIKREVN